MLTGQYTKVQGGYILNYARKQFCHHTGGVETLINTKPRHLLDNNVLLSIYSQILSDSKFQITTLV